jgi:hypothetical protein
MAAGRDGIKGAERAAVETDLVEEVQRKTLLNDEKNEEVELGIDAGLRDSARSLSTAALIR